MVSWGTLYLLAAVVFLFYAWMKHNYGYWARRGIAFIKPLPLVGNMLPLIMQKQPFSKTLQDQYYELKPHKFGGTFAFMKPSLTLTDPEIIKEITVKSFDHFADRRFVINSRTDPLAHRVLICLKGKEWRDMRNLLSPVFTKSKLRGMFPLVSRCGEQFATFMAKQSDASNSPIEFKSATTRFANDIIATVAFGVECNSANNPKEEFYSFAQGISESILNNFRKLSLNAIGYSIVPKFMEFLDIPILPRSSSTFFRNIITSTKKHREENNITRPDMIQVLMSAQKGIVKKEQGEDHEHYVSSVGEGKEATDYYHKHLKTEKENTKKITDDDIAAQALVFFFAGYETVSVLLTFLAYELAVNPDIQRRLQEEIDTVISENGGQFTYDSLQEMKYLDMVISETLRKNPPAAFSDRMCTKDFQIPGTKITIEKGTTIMIPFYALHRDPEYFPDPNTFDPERFNEENKKNIKPYTYLPFGSGPHNCIGTRLALLEAQVCAVFLMASCDLQVCSKTQIPLQLSNKSFQMVSDAGCWLLCTPRENPSIKLDL